MKTMPEDDIKKEAADYTGIHRQNNLSRNVCFIKLVEYNFDVFFSQFGFLKYNNDKLNDCIMSYCKEEVVFSIYWDCHRSYEIDMDISYKNITYSIADFIGFFDYKIYKNYHNYCAVTMDQLNKGLLFYKELIIMYCSDILNNNLSILDKIKCETENWKNEYFEKLRLDAIRPEANMAFKKRDFEKAAGLFESIENHLTKSEKMKLEYAQKYCDGAPNRRGNGP